MPTEADTYFASADEGILRTLQQLVELDAGRVANLNNPTPVNKMIFLEEHLDKQLFSRAYIETCVHESRRRETLTTVQFGLYQRAVLHELETFGVDRLHAEIELRGLRLALKLPRSASLPEQHVGSSAMYYTLLYDSQLICERSRVSDPRLQDVSRLIQTELAVAFRARPPRNREAAALTFTQIKAQVEAAPPRRPAAASNHVRRRAPL